MSVSKLKLVSVDFNQDSYKRVLTKMLAQENFNPELASKFIEKVAGHDLYINTGSKKRGYDGVIENVLNTKEIHDDVKDKVINRIQVNKEYNEEQVFEQLLNKMETSSEQFNLKFECKDCSFVNFDILEENLFVDNILTKIKKIHHVINEIDKVIKENKQAVTQLNNVNNLDVNFDELFTSKYLQVRIGKVPTINLSKLELYESYPYLMTLFNQEGEYTWCMYITTPLHETKVDNAFGSVKFKRIKIPDFIHGKPGLAIKEIEEETTFLLGQKNELYSRIDKIVKDNEERLNSIYTILKQNQDIISLKKYVVQTGYGFAINGFVPDENIEEFKEDFKGIDNVEIEIHPATSDARLTPPTRLKNNWFIRPFKMFVEMYGVPSYNDIDPTLFVAISYTLLFGIMFGDVGQGIVLSIVGYLAYKLKGMTLGEVGIRLGISSAIFGFVFGSVFGNEHILVPLFHPMDSSNTMTLLLFAVGLGIGLIVIAMLFNIYINIKNRNIVDALLDKNGVCGLVFYLSVLLYVVSMMGIVKVSGLIVYVILIALLLIFLKEPLERKFEGQKMFPLGFGSFFMEGFFELFEVVLSFITNTMSFLRVGGFVLSHAGMMLVVYTLAEMVGGMGYWIVLVIGNAIVMGIEGLIVGIQVLRLEFYEMFSRYYKGNGTLFVGIKKN